MRSRNIKPGIYKNEQLVECSFPARWLFPGLWCLADCEGRLENRPKRIKMEIFPGDNVDIEALLQELESQGLIMMYGAEATSARQPYIWIPKFTKHQTPHINERKSGSKIPPHPDDQGTSSLNDSEQDSDSNETGTMLVSEVSGASTVQVSDKSGTNPADTRYPNPDSGLLIADTRIPKPDSRNHTGTARQPTGPPTKPSAPSGSASVSAVLSQFGLSAGTDPAQELLKRILVVSRDPPAYAGWWRDVIALMMATDGLGVLLEAVGYAEDCSDESVRKTKDLGPLGKPGAFIASQCQKHLKACQRSLPRPPEVRKIG